MLSYYNSTFNHVFDYLVSQIGRDITKLIFNEIEREILCFDRIIESLDQGSIIWITYENGSHGQWRPLLIEDDVKYKHRSWYKFPAYFTASCLCGDRDCENLA